MQPTAQILDGGFSDVVMQSQAVFRTIMDAMAQPGTIKSIDVSLNPPALLSKSMAAIACTLVDADTPIWLDAKLAASAEVKSWLTFQTGAPVTSDAGEASFALVSDLGQMPPLENFALGTQEYPDRSSTLILQVNSLDAGAPLTLAGPGIRDTAIFSPVPLPSDFLKQWATNHAFFPRGVDLVLAGPDAVACLPRSTRIAQEEG